MDLGTVGATRFSRSRGRITGSGTSGISYPSPFFDIGHTYLPTTVKQMFRWCRYYFLVHPLINSIIFKMAQYPITDLVYHTDDPHLKDRWREIFEDVLKYRCFQMEIGLDFNTYGNGFVSMFFPFRKIIECTNCHNSEAAKDARYYFRNFQFYWKCPRCGHHGPTKVYDRYIKSTRGIRLLRWNPEDIDVRYNDLNGQYTYFYDIPVKLKNDIIMGRRHIVEEVPQVFIEALRRKKAIVFNNDNIYHFRRPTLAGKDRGWGIPLILPVLKDAFYLQILKKSQECVSLTSELETSGGLVQADDVRVGDLVRTHTGAWKSVEKKWYRDAREEEVGRKITLTSLRGYPTTYSPQHPIFTIRRNGINRRTDTREAPRSSIILSRPHLYEEVLCPAEQLGIGEYVLYPRYLPVQETTYVDVALRTGLVSTDGFVYSGCCEDTAVAFESLERGERVPHDNPGRVAKRAIRDGRTPKRMPRIIPMTDDLAYILGWYAGDGSCNARSVFFSLGKGDDSLSLIGAIQREFGVTPTVEEGKSVNTVVLSDVIVRHLIKGLVPGTARHKKAPEEVLNAPNSMKLSYLRGLWEADGSAGEKSICITSTSRNQAYDVYRIAIHVGCIASIGKSKPSVSVIDGREVRSKGSYNVTVCNASADRLRSLWECGEGPDITSGKSGFFWGDYFATRICAIEEVEEAQYIDFKVADDTTFCVPGTATKNSIALDHIVPLRVMFPQTGSATADPFSMVNLSEWKDQIAEEIQRWRLDNNYIPILPLPIGNQTIGGDGRALLLGQEIRVWSEQIVTGLGIPIELIFGGLSYSGSNVSLRMLENMFINYMHDHIDLTKWVVRKISSYMDWPSITIKFKPFKMADDLQRKAFNLQLSQVGKISDDSLLSDADFDPDHEDKQIENETNRRAEAQKKARLAQAEIEGASQMIMMRYQMKAQQEQMQMQMQGAPAPGEPGAEAHGVAEESGMQPQQPPPEQGGPGTAPLPQQMMAAQALPPIPAQARAELPPAMSEMESPLNMAQQVGQVNQDQAGQMNVDLIAQAQMVAGQLMRMDENSRTMVLMNLRQQSPEFYQVVLGLMQSMVAGGPTAEPPPEQQAPQRGREAAAV